MLFKMDSPPARKKFQEEFKVQSLEIDKNAQALIDLIFVAVMGLSIK